MNSGRGLQGAAWHGITAQLPHPKSLEYPLKCSPKQLLGLRASGELTKCPAKTLSLNYLKNIASFTTPSPKIYIHFTPLFPASVIDARIGAL